MFGSVGEGGEVGLLPGGQGRGEGGGHEVGAVTRLHLVVLGSGHYLNLGQNNVYIYKYLVHRYV